MPVSLPGRSGSGSRKTRLRVRAEPAADENRREEKLTEPGEFAARGLVLLAAVLSAGPRKNKATHYGDFAFMRRLRITPYRRYG
jgi:hypothetical protein